MPNHISAVIHRLGTDPNRTKHKLPLLLVILALISTTRADNSFQFFATDTDSDISYKPKKVFQPSKYLRNVYITLGPYFSDRSDERVFRVGATLDYLTSSKTQQQRKSVEEFENEITGKALDREIEHVKLDKENFMKLMTMDFREKAEPERIADFLEEQRKINKIAKFSAGVSIDYPSSTEVNNSQSRFYTEKQRTQRNQHFLDSVQLLMEQLRNPKDPDNEQERTQAEALRRTEMFQVFQRLLSKKDLGMDLLRNANGAVKKSNRLNQLILKKISLTDSIMEYYKTYCDRDYLNCRKRLSPEEMQKESRAGHLDVKNELWTMTNGSPRLSLSLIKLVVTTHNEEKFEFGISDLNEYKYKGFYKGEPLDYQRIFIFFDITNEVSNLSRFKYEIYYKDTLVKGPYNFSSNVKNPVAKPKIVSMGFHDTSIFGQTAIDKLSSFHYDLLVIPGNIGLEAYQNNFRNLEDYFDAMEKNLTRAPVMMMPGLGEKIDNFSMFGSKFQTLNLRTHLAMDVYQCYINNISIYFLNVAKVVNTIYRFSQVYENFLELLQNIISLEKKTNRSPKWRVLVTNEPLFCSGVSLDNQKCMKNLFLLKPFHDLARAFGIEVFLSGGTSYYERIELPDFKELGERRKESRIEEEKKRQQMSLHAATSQLDTRPEQAQKPARIGNRVLEGRRIEDEEEASASEMNLEDMERELYLDALNEDIVENHAIARDQTGTSLNASGSSTSLAQKRSRRRFTEVDLRQSAAMNKDNESFFGFFNKENLQTYFPVIRPFFRMKGPSYIINVGSAGFSRGFTPSRLNNDKFITKNKKTSMKGFVLLTFLNRDSRLFYIDFKNLEIQDFILISSKKIHLIVYKYFFVIFCVLGFLAVCVYSNGTTCLRLGGCFKLSKNSNDFEYLLYEQKKIAQQVREEEKVEEMIEAQKKAEERQRRAEEKVKVQITPHAEDDSANEMSVHND